MGHLWKRCTVYGQCLMEFAYVVPRRIRSKRAIRWDVETFGDFTSFTHCASIMKDKQLNCTIESKQSWKSRLGRLFHWKHSKEDTLSGLAGMPQVVVPERSSSASTSHSSCDSLHRVSSLSEIKPRVMRSKSVCVRKPIGFRKRAETDVLALRHDSHAANFVQADCFKMKVFQFSASDRTILRNSPAARTCINCQKQFRECLSPFRDYCTLDCKSAYRLRKPNQEAPKCSKSNSMPLKW